MCIGALSADDARAMKLFVLVLQHCRTNVSLVFHQKYSAFTAMHQFVLHTGVKG